MKLAKTAILCGISFAVRNKKAPEPSERELLPFGAVSFDYLA